MEETREYKKEHRQIKDLLSWRPHPVVVKVWRIIRPLLVIAISISISYYAISTVITKFASKYFMPVDLNDATPIMVVVEQSDSTSRIATKLRNACGEGEEGVITNTAIFKVYVDFVGKSSKWKAGTYILSRNMDIPQIVDIICTGNPPKKTKSFTVLEGYTIAGVLASLEKAELYIDEKLFLELCNDKEKFEKYDFINKVVGGGLGGNKRDYMLEGYLFPDTYIVFEDATPDDIITKMLVRFNEIFTEEYIARSEELGMTIDEVVTLASIIQREAAIEEDFAKVSAVFHNRLKDGQKLESCATLQYVLKVNKYQYNEQERATDSPYNTYLHTGLPVAPIGNPGKQAIEAALYPNEEYIEKDYRFFCNMELPENKALIFARTYDEHQKNVRKYEKFWGTTG